MDVQSNHGEMSKSEAAVWFWSVCLAFSGLWILLPFLFHEGYRFDVIELQLVAKEWVIAYRKLPMLPAWILETLNLLTNRAFIAPFIGAAFCTIITLFSVWQLARHVLSERLALIGTFTMLPFWSISVDSVNFNHNSTLMACWSLSMWTFYNAFQTNKKRWWIAAGLALGLGFHSKYTILLLALALLLYSLWIPRFRRYWKEIGPYLTVLITLLIFLPHLIVLYQMGFWTNIAYAADQAYQEETWRVGARIYYPIEWAACQLGWVFFSPLLLLLPSLGLKWKMQISQSECEKETRQFLFCCMAFPFLVYVAIATILGCKIYSAYGYTLWFFLGVYLLLRFQRMDSRIVFRRTIGWTALVILAMVITFIIQATVSPYLNGTPRGFQFPMRALGAECDRIWSDRFGDLPCPYTSGQWQLAGNAAYAMKNRPSVHFYYRGLGNLETLPTGTWSTDDDVNQKGGLILWDASKTSEHTIPRWVHLRFPRAEVLPEILLLHYNMGTDIPPLKIGVAIVPPQE